MAGAFLFDLDGTLIDSMPHHERAWVHWYARRNLAAADGNSFAATAGRANAEILGELFPSHSAAAIDAMAHEKEAIYREFAAQSLDLIAGAEEFLTQARAAGLRLAVCTASTPLNMALAFDRFGIDGWVDTVTSPADVLSAGLAGSSGSSAGSPIRGKPYPDIFLEAAHRLGIAPADCIVFEDAPLGVEAARRAGMKAVVLTTTLPGAAFAEFDNVIALGADFTTFDLPALVAVAAPITAARDAPTPAKASHDA